MKALEEISRQKTEFDKKFEEDGKAALEAGFAEFFAANPGIAAVRWVQFTVDVVDVGDDGVDGVDDPVFKLAGGAEAASDDDEEEEENEDAEEEDDEFLDVENIVDPSLRRACKILGGQLTGHEELFYALFDTAAEVTVTREGFEVEELETE